MRLNVLLIVVLIQSKYFWLDTVTPCTDTAGRARQTQMEKEQKHANLNARSN